MRRTEQDTGEGQVRPGCDCEVQSCMKSPGYSSVWLSLNRLSEGKVHNRIARLRQQREDFPVDGVMCIGFKSTQFMCQFQLFVTFKDISWFVYMLVVYVVASLV